MTDERMSAAITACALMIKGICLTKPRDEWTARIEARIRFMLKSSASPIAPDQPIPMVLYCPNCGTQHIDAAEPERLKPFDSGADIEYIRTPAWDNPPHRSHKCGACQCIWRPADVPTTGVERIATEGKADTWPNGLPEDAAAAPAQSDARETKSPVVDPVTTEVFTNPAQWKAHYLPNDFTLGDNTRNIASVVTPDAISKAMRLDEAVADPQPAQTAQSGEAFDAMLHQTLLGYDDNGDAFFGTDPDPLAKRCAQPTTTVESGNAGGDK